MQNQTGIAKDIQIGCQTNAWPIDPSRPETLYLTLAEIAELRFSGFETGFRNILPLATRPNEFRNEQRGLTVFGVHIFLQEYDAETQLPPRDLVLHVAAAASRLGAERLILSGSPANANGQTGSAETKAKALNEIANSIKPLGLTLAYHNHGPEFAGAQPEIETLLSVAEPELVWFLLDAGHCFRAGVDVPEFLNRHADRLAGLHLRDFQSGRQVPLGQGAFPLKRTAEALQNWRGWVLAEEEREDNSKLGATAVRPARETLKEAFGI